MKCRKIDSLLVNLCAVLLYPKREKKDK